MQSKHRDEPGLVGARSDKSKEKAGRRPAVTRRKALLALAAGWILWLALDLLGIDTLIAAPAPALPAALDEAAAQTAEGTVLHEEWAVIRILGAEMGRAHTIVRRVGEGDDARVRMKVRSEIEITRAGATIEMVTEVESSENLAGELEWLHSSSLMSSQETVTEVRVVGDELEIVQSVYGQESKRAIPWEKGVLGPWMASQQALPKLETPGATYSYKTFIPDMGNQIATVEGKIIGRVDKQILEETRSVVEVHETLSVLPGVTSKSWLAPDGSRTMQSVPIAGGIDTIVCSKERAMSGPEGGAGASVDALIGLAAESNVSLPYPYSIESATYRITLKEGDVKAFAERLESPRQRVLEIDGNQLVLHVRAVPAPEGATMPIPIESGPVSTEYLESNAWLQSDDPAMKRAASDAIGDEVDAWKVAKKLENWVYGAIGDKNMTVGFASAKEVLENPAGDCSEHAVLLAGALRAVGVPARVSMGLLYWNRTFAGHAWTEAWVGQWIPLDATMARPFVSAAHIDLDRSSLSDEGIEELFLSLGVAIGNVSVEVLEFTQGGKTVRVDESFRPYKVDGRTYENPVYGLRLERPEGWSFESLQAAGFGSLLFEIHEDDDKGRMAIVTVALPYNADFFDVFEQIVAGRPVHERGEIDVDGRKGERVVLEGGDGTEVLCAIKDEELMFLFVGRLKSPTSRAAFDAMLESVRWLE